MEKAQFLEILSKYLDGRATKEEEQFLYAYYHLFMAEPDVTTLLEQNEKETLKLSIKAGIDNHFNRTSVAADKKLRLWPRTVAAAAILLLISTVIYFHVASNQPQNTSDTKYTQDLAPGTTGATLTLANGKKIHISDVVNGLIAQDPGVKITKSADGKITYQIIPGQQPTHTAYHTLSTAKGETFQILLPDKSMVYLNAASTLRYPTSFKGGERNVELSGEAYFEISKNADMPFHVVTESQTIEVLGTHFNVNNYPEEAYVTTTLLEGRVKILSDGEEAILKPGQQSTVAGKLQNSTYGIKINAVNTEEAIAWKKGWFQFENADIKTVMNEIGRWYGVDIVYSGKIPEDHYKGKVSRNVKVSQVLKILETSGINFKIEGKTIIVK